MKERPVMPALKPCPFCGGAAHITSEVGDPWDDIGKFHYVRCGTCRARSGAKYASNGNDCPIFYQEVRAEWNHRSGDAEGCSNG
ncbi:Lar family restriction alleviation protein [Serratia marcescens]|nr:Lar family restriction alleviation protein [Serratia marcescens]